MRSVAGSLLLKGRAMAETREQKLAREMTHQPNNAVDILTPIGRGLRRWLPDLIALPGDIADAAIYAGRKVAQGQNQRSVPSAGLGAASRRWAQERLHINKPREQTEMSVPEEYGNPQQTALEEMVAMANPTMWNPLLLAKPEVLGGLAAAFGGMPGMLGVVKGKGGNWLTGSVEDALRGLKLPGSNRVYDHRGNEILPSPEVLEGFKNNQSINQWIEGPLTKYVKTRMASPEDEVRRLAEQGVLHVDPAQLHAPIGLHSGVTRQELGQSPVAKRWEFASDSFVAPETAGLFKVTRGQDGTTTLSRNPWLADLPNDATVYDLGARAHPENLGFPHLIDELSNALNPNSGLPRHLQLTPEAIQKMSMEKAVRRVAEINAWRAATKAEANRALAEKASIVREYAENNPKGLRWVELKKGEPSGNPQDAWNGNSPDELLRQQLKYEGETMQHCVGGYCPDVLEGRSRIFSLRDAKGEPHVTVEVSPQPRNVGQQDIPQRYIDDAMERLGIDSPETQWGREEEIDRLAGDLWRKDNPDVTRIVQIKGKQNRAPNVEYLPFVQDFVRNSPLGTAWSDVGDLGNAGLLRGNKGSFLTRDEYVAQPEVQAALESQLKAFPGMNREDLITEMLKAKGHLASGGPVRSIDDELEAFLLNPTGE